MTWLWITLAIAIGSPVAFVLGVAIGATLADAIEYRLKPWLNRRRRP
jgi:predicted MFS family arabinose efflux permease